MNNIIVLDLETARSADDCRDCGLPRTQWGAYGVDFSCVGANGHMAIGWSNKPALGLSVGCYWDSHDGRIHWFDEETLEATVRLFVTRHPLLVSYNGIGFDFPLMRGILRRRAETELPPDKAPELVALCDAFKGLCAASYDILAELWTADPGGKLVKGLNSLDSIAQANGLGGKTGHGAQAPRDWAAGKWASVLNYCAHDVYLTKGLFDLACAGTPIQRAIGRAVLLPIPQEPAS